MIGVCFFFHFSLIFDRFLSISTINITPLINTAVEGRTLAGYALLPAARIEPYDHGTRYSSEFSTYNVFSI